MAQQLHAPSALTRCVMLVFMRLSSWCRFTSSQIALTAATASTNTSAAVEPRPLKGEITLHQARPACSPGTKGGSFAGAWRRGSAVQPHRNQAANMLGCSCWRPMPPAMGLSPVQRAHLEQTIEVCHAGEHVEEEEGEEGDDVVL